MHTIVAEADWRAELGARTTEMLGRFGVAGRVEVESQLAWLIGSGPTVEVRLTESDLALAAAGAGNLEQLAERLARGLARARRNAAGQTDSQLNWQSWARLIPPFLVTAVGLWLAFRYFVPHRSTDGRVASSRAARLSRGGPNRTTNANDRQALADENCARVVTRIQQGGSVSPLDVDGWLVELSLVSESNALEPGAEALDNYFSRQTGSIERNHHAPDTPLLNQAAGAEAGVLVSKHPLGLARPTGSGITITWRGKYVAHYFDQQDRFEYVRTADALFEDLHAKYGALYARCVQGPARYMGSWFRGPTVGGALWVLVAEMELMSGSSLIPGLSNATGPEGWIEPLNQLAVKLEAVSRKRATMILAKSGGSVSERPTRFATVEFPFSPANRANLASAAIARRIWANSKESTLAPPANP